MIRAILAKRMCRAGLTVELEAVFKEDALTHLEAWYGSRPRDIRTILRIADQAVSAAALARDSEVGRAHILVAARNVRGELPY